MVDYAAILERFHRLASSPRDTQQETLRRILRNAEQSAYGRAHGFDAIHDPDEYRRRVPLATFEDFRPWLEKDPSALTGVRPDYFMRTSGTTGKPKYIPFTSSFQQAIRAAHEVFCAAIFRDFPFLPMVPGELPRGLGLYQINPETESFHDVPLSTFVTRGFFEIAFPEDPFFRALPREIGLIPEASDWLYAHALSASRWDLRGIRCTNPTTLLLFARQIEERTDELIGDIEAGRMRARPELDAALARATRPDPELARRLRALGRPLTPRDLWPNLEVLIVWRAGACHLFEPYLRERFGEIRIRAVFSASTESPIAIPITDDMRGGVPAIESVFFEFRPAGEEGDRTVLLDQLEQGGRYELIFTTANGLYRYQIGDLVQCDGRYAGCPTFSFLARKGRNSSLTGEKLTELQVEESMDACTSKLRLSPLYYVLSAQVEEVPYYVLSVEWRPPAPAPAAFAPLAEMLDGVLQETNIEYRTKRESQRIGPIVVREVLPGEFERMYASGVTGFKGSAYKLPHVSIDPIHTRLRASNR